MKNILITGGAGFIGSNLALKLIDKGYNITVLDNLSPQIHTSDSPLYKSIKDKVNFIFGDVRNRNDWLKAIENQDAVVHLAAETGTGQSMYEIEKYTEVNIKGTALFLDILTNTKHSIERIVIASSRAVYGEGKYKCTNHGYVYPNSRSLADMENGDFEVKCPVCAANVELCSTDENSLLHPTSIYGITKRTQEEMFLTVAKSIGIPAVAFRYQNVYGPGQSLSNPYTGILSIFSTRIKNRKSLNIFEDGRESRDFVYIDDVVEATILGLKKKESAWQVFNVGCGKPISILEVAKLLIANYGIEVKIDITGNFRVGDIRHNFADLKKINNILGFYPKVSFENGISEFCKWVNNQNHIERDKYDFALKEMKEKGLFK